MKKEFSRKDFGKCLARSIGELKARELRLDDLDGEDALNAAARLVEASAYNLAQEVDSEDVIDLMMLSQQLAEFAKYVAKIRAETAETRRKLN